MPVFQIRNMAGLLSLVVSVLVSMALLILLPASFLMVLWNTFVFEMFHGPEISLYQGALLLGVLLVLIKMVFFPSLRIEFYAWKTNRDSLHHPDRLSNPEAFFQLLKQQKKKPQPKSKTDENQTDVNLKP